MAALSESLVGARQQLADQKQPQIGNPMWSHNPFGLRTTTVQPRHLTFDALSQLFIYGDGVDGDVTISADTTLSRDVVYNNLTVNSGKVLTTAGYRIFVKNTFINNGTLRWNGNTGASGTITGNPGIAPTPGAALAAGTMGASGAGGQSNGNASAAGGNGSSGASISEAIGGAGGTGGNGTDGIIGGVGGSTSQTHANRHGLVLLSDSAFVNGGAGGCGGGMGNITGSNEWWGGSGGSGGGVIIVSAKTFNNAGVIECKGGNGGTGEPTGGFACGGAGGGGGGAIVIVYRTLTARGTLTVAGGIGGGGTFGGGAGGTGSTGLALLIQQAA